MTDDLELQKTLNRIAHALERIAPKTFDHIDIGDDLSYLWNPHRAVLTPVPNTHALPLDIFVSRDRQIDMLLQNTQAIANGLPANHALLWGARGTGKSSIVKSVHAHINKTHKTPVVLIEINRADLATLPDLLDVIRRSGKPVILFCDDLSFDYTDDVYKNLKSALEGSTSGPSSNVVFYATSNRRHMVSRQMIENDRKAAIHESEVIEEKVSLSDRFGLWIGFHALDQDDYLKIIQNYIDAYKIPVEIDTWRPQAIEWTVTRGSRSGRVAWQFIVHLAGQYNVKIEL